VKLSDVVSNAGLSSFAELALVLFVLAFAAIIWWVFRPSARARWKSDAQMPLDDENPQQPRDPEKRS
jgi:cbb3-type cytochrome oxidase subunit 3